MSKHKYLSYEWDLYFDVKDTYQLQCEYKKLKKTVKHAEDQLKLMREMAQKEGLLKYLKDD